MPSSYTPLAGLTQQATGEGDDIWGVIQNDGVIQLVDDALKGAAAIVVSGTVTLSNTNGVTNQARMRGLKVTGTGGTIIVPGVQGCRYIDATAATGPISVTTGSGATATVPNGMVAEVVCPNGVDCYLVQDPSSRAYTDAKVLQANTANLPGGSTPGSFLYTDPVTGNAVWHVPQFVDVNGLAAALAAQKALSVAFAVAL